APKVNVPIRLCGAAPTTPPASRGAGSGVFVEYFFRAYALRADWLLVSRARVVHAFAGPGTLHHPDPAHADGYGRAGAGGAGGLGRLDRDHGRQPISGRGR